MKRTWYVVGKEEYVFGPKRVLKFSDKAMILVPKSLVDKLLGKYVLVNLLVVGEEGEEKESEGKENKT